MKLPKSVKIGPHTVPIELGPDSLDICGQYTYDPPSIVIRKGMDHTNTADTLLHEILHGVWKQAGLHYIMEIEDLRDREEGLVLVLATQMIEVFRDNPEVVEFITS